MLICVFIRFKTVVHFLKLLCVQAKVLSRKKFYFFLPQNSLNWWQSSLMLEIQELGNLFHHRWQIQQRFLKEMIVRILLDRLKYRVVGNYLMMGHYYYYELIWILDIASNVVWIFNLLLKFITIPTKYWNNTCDVSNKSKVEQWIHFIKEQGSEFLAASSFAFES